MVRDAFRRIVGGNDTDRERCADSREGKRPDQKIAADGLPVRLIPQLTDRKQSAGLWSWG